MTTGPVPLDAPTSVFVDESGRRRARARIVARIIVAGAGMYVLVVIAGLTGSVSLPGVQLGELRRADPGRAETSRLGAGSKVLSLPAALKPSRSNVDRAPIGAAPGAGVTTPAPTNPPSGRSSSSAPGTTDRTPNTNHRPTTTLPPRSTTTSTRPITTTTKGRGPPTSTPHGPPSTTPGHGKGRSKL